MNEDEEDIELECILNAELKLDDLMSGRRMGPREREEFKRAIWDLIAEEDRMAGLDGDDVLRSEIGFNKWRLIQRYVRFNPYRDRPHLKRSEQWAEALDFYRDLRERDLIDYLMVNIDVARNLEAGIQDMRPRKMGPTYLATLEYVANRKRKALAILHFAQEGARHGVFTINSEWHQKTAAILEKYKLIERDEEGRPIYSKDPFVRS